MKGGDMAVSSNWENGCVGISRSMASIRKNIGELREIVLTSAQTVEATRAALRKANDLLGSRWATEKSN
jgi:hypothetical protein